MDISGLSGKADKIPDAPDSYCQWELTKDRMGLEWDGGEKFYMYEEWLQYLHDRFLKPHGVTLNGGVSFQGEDTEDCGALRMVNGRVEKTTIALVSDELDELKRFRDFVLASDYGDDIKREWADQLNK